MRFRAPMIQCDAEDGYCGGQTVDYYEQTASSVNGTLVTAARRAPGWRSTVMGEDYCPEHAGLADHLAGADPTEKNGDRR